MVRTPVLAFRPDIALVKDSGPEPRLEVHGTKIGLGSPSPGLLAALKLLSSAGATEDSLSEVIQETDGDGALPSFYFHLERWIQASLLRYMILEGGEPIAIVEPMIRGFRPEMQGVGGDARFLLSRFAYARRDKDRLVIESPLSPVRTILPTAMGGTLLGEMAGPRTYRQLSDTIMGLSADGAQALLSLLSCVGVVGEVMEDGSLSEDGNAALQQWEFHDLLFHSRSRLGRHDYPFGGTYRFQGKIPPLPALKPKMSTEVFPLAKPRLDRQVQHASPFTHVLEARRSIRDYGNPPITVEQLGEFLHRVARVRQVIDEDLTGGRPYQITHRTYPSGGATYDLESYVIANVCSGLAPGIYHYDPLDHELCKIGQVNSQVEALLQYARVAAPGSGELQVLIVLASRFQRLSWKYSSMAYATTLKNVGVLYQTMYLVATDMGLAPCALGGGNSDLFAEAVRTDYFTESSVGEFLLGTPA
jgi:oxazoline/thiazoline dehydrogenase